MLLVSLLLSTRFSQCSIHFSEPVWKFPYTPYQLCETHVSAHPIEYSSTVIWENCVTGTFQICTFWLYWCMFAISSISRCYRHEASCSADAGSFRYLSLREEVNHKNERPIFPNQFRGSGLIWSWLPKMTNKHASGCNPRVPSSEQTRTPEWLNTRIDLVSCRICPLARFPRVHHFHWDLPGTKWSPVGSEFSEGTTVFQTMCRPGGHRKE